MFQNIIEILILSLVQGVSEFLPISSSAHLIIIETLYDFKNSSLLIDISLHLGSLTAIIFYFRKDLLNLKNNQQLLTLIFGILLFLADKNNFNKKISSDLNLKSILLIGLFQILSLIPGVSRAGITITAARILKFNRVDSSKISFLLSIPALAGASFLSLKNLTLETIEYNMLVLVAIFLSFIFSYITVKYFLIYINKFSMNAFVIYNIGI